MASTTAPPSSPPPAGTATASSSADDAIIQPGKAPGQTGNRIFTGLSFGAGTFIMVVLALVAAFLIREALPALTASRETLESVSFMRDRSLWGYVAPLVFGTLLSSTIALGVAVPLSIGVALFISHFAPRRLAQALGYMVDLLAAIPSVVFGLWGFLWLVPLLDPLNTWLSEHLGLIPEFIGRLPVIATVQDLGVSELVRVMTEPKNALVSQYQYLFSLDGVELELTDAAIEAVASLALERKTGARGLTSIVEEVLGQAMFEVPSLPEVGRVVVDADAVRGTGRPRYQAGSGTLSSTTKVGERSRTA